MALDIAIIGKDGRPETEFAIGVDPHWRLMTLAKGGGLELLLRLQDYYEETFYAVEEISQLLGEIDVASRQTAKDAELAKILADFRALALSALNRKVGLAVLPD
jgi:hypothetical protein